MYAHQPLVHWLSTAYLQSSLQKTINACQTELARTDSRLEELRSNVVTTRTMRESQQCTEVEADSQLAGLGHSIETQTAIRSRVEQRLVAAQEKREFRSLVGIGGTLNGER